MAATDGGWMSDYDTYPLYSNPYKDGFDLPNNGRFTCFQVHVPCLVSGSKSEWNRVTELLMFSYQMHSHEFWSDMLALESIKKMGAYNPTKDVITIHDVYFKRGAKESSNAEILDPYSLSSRCASTKGKRAIHFSHASCNRVGFCHNKRDKVLNKWVEAWKQQCLGINTD